MRYGGSGVIFGGLGHEDVTQRLAEFRAVAHRQLAVQELLKEDVLIIRQEMQPSLFSRSEKR